MVLYVYEYYVSNDIFIHCRAGLNRLEYFEILAY